MKIFNLFKKEDLQTKRTKAQIDNISIKRLIPECEKWRNDTIIINTSRNCKLCKKYNNQIYSLFGWNKKYPVVPNFILQRKCPECNKIIGATIKL